MTVEFTDWAKDILQRADAGARRLNPDARVRLVRAAAGMEAVLSDTPAADDDVVSIGQATIFVERALNGLVDIEEPHDRLVLKPHGSQPNIREEHG
ncbi:MAG TPA: hypothetical protein VJ818_07100 [Actinomycetota bacterium]|nr:hypothetical protein [Actinomycetota bacterium]